MRRSTALGGSAAYMLSVLAVAPAAFGQGSGTLWFVANPGAPHPVAKVKGDPPLGDVGIVCSAGKPLIALNLGNGRLPPVISTTVHVDGWSMPLTIRRVGTGSIWAAPLADTQLLDRMAGGTSARFDFGANGSPRVSLNGSAAAFRAALGGCYRAALPPAPAKQPARLPPLPAGAVDVTGAGFPFRLGYYIFAGTCRPGNYDAVEFGRDFSHEYEADQQTDFDRIVRMPNGSYRIEETLEGDEKVEGDGWTADYLRTGPDSFRRTEHLSWDVNGATLKGGATRIVVTQFRYCSNASLGIDPR